MREKLGLKRELNMWEVVLSGVGIILGAGIYVLVGKAAGLAGNATWLSFFFAALVAAFTGLSYAELSSIFPKAGAEYVYTKKALGNMAAFVIGWMLVISGIFAGAGVAVGFGGYFAALFSTPAVLAAVVIILISSFIIFYGIKQSAWTAIIMTLIEAAGLVLIILIAMPFIGSVNYFEMPGGLPGVFAAGALIFFAFLGFEEIVRLSEETKKPKTMIPRALVISIIITTILYILVAIAAVSVIPWESLAESSSPLADVASAAMGSNMFVVLSIIALFSTFNTVLLELLATSRILYGMADFHSIPGPIAYIHRIRRTPWVAIMIVCIGALLVTMINDIEILAAMTDFTIFVTFIVINAVAIVLRYKIPEAKRKFRMRVNIGKFPVIPLLGIISTGFLLANLGLQAILYGFALLVAGLIVFGILKKSGFQ